MPVAHLEERRHALLCLLRDTRGQSQLDGMGLLASPTSKAGDQKREKDNKKSAVEEARATDPTAGMSAEELERYAAAQDLSAIGGYDVMLVFRALEKNNDDRNAAFNWLLMGGAAVEKVRVFMLGYVIFDKCCGLALTC